MRTPTRCLPIALCAMMWATAPQVRAQVTMSTSGNYPQDFNTLGTAASNPWTENSTLPAWLWQSASSTGALSNPLATYNASTGTGTTGTGYSYASAAVPGDRAMGSICSNGTGALAYGLILQNTSGVTITDISVAYTGEQWRNGGNATAQTLSFYFKTFNALPSALNPGPSQSGTWTNVPALNFTGPIATTTAAALDGNAGGNRIVFPATPLPAISLANNDYIVIKWDDPNDSGTDHGLSIDDLTVSWVVNATAPNVGFSPALNTVAEGASQTVNVTMDIAPSSEVTVNVADALTGSASSGTDYTAFSTTPLIFPTGGTYPMTQSVTLFTTEDPDYEPTETVNLSLSLGGGSANIAPSSYQLSINDNDPPPLVLNEVDYDNPGTDASEFVEIKNNGASAIDIGGFKIELVNGATGAAVYTTITLPSFSLAAGGYYVVGNDPAIPNINLVISPASNFAPQNGSPDAVALRDPSNVLLDAVSYEGNTGAPYTEGTGIAIIDSDDGTDGIGISRFPDGADTQDNAADWSRRCLSPGAANNSSQVNCVCAPPEATADVQCIDNNTFQITVHVTSTGSGAIVNITNDANASSALNAGVGDHILGPFNNNTSVNVTVAHESFSQCDITINGLFGNCALDCNGVQGGPAVPGSPCDDLDPETTNDVWSPTCVCEGTLIQPVVSFVLPTSTSGEADVAMTVGIEMDMAPDAPVVVDITDLLTGSATSGSDYTAIGPLQFTFLPTDFYPYLQTFNVILNDDPDYESTETFNLALSINSGMAMTGTSSFVGVITSDDLPSLRINEVDYDNAGTDNAEWIELKNTGSTAFDIAGFSVQLINGNTGGAAIYKTIVLPSFNLPAGGYYVIGNNASIPNLNLLQTPATDMIQNGAPDAVGLRDPFNTLIDAISYEGNTGAPYTETAGMPVTEFDDNVLATKVIARYLDGNDTDDNSVDWKVWCATPGASNATVDPDGDVIPDCLDNCPNLFGVQGDACDDNNACTINDVITNACVCAGTFQDTDSDGVCDADDDCPGVPGEFGSACDDGNACTIGDLLDATCTCVGTFQDTDSDGVCDADDDCPSVPGEFGSTCSDGDPCTIGDVIDVNCVCVGTYQDTDGDGVCDGNDNCPLVQGQIGSPCDDGDPDTEDDIVGANCVCTGTPVGVCNGNAAELRIQLNSAGGDGITWEIRDEFQMPVASGGDYPGQPNALIIEDLCLPSIPYSCYTFFLFDSFGDGIAGGSWELRDEFGSTILRDNGSFTTQVPSVSSTIGATGHSFCLPLGPAEPMLDECGVFTNALSDKVYSEVVPGALYYQFEFSDPNVGFIRRILVPRNWVKLSEMQSVPLVPGTVYFCRVRADQGASGVADDKFGAGCELGLDPNAANPCTQLINDPDLSTHSCGATKTWGGQSKVWAKPIVNANQYRFRFTNAGLGYNRIIAQPSYVCPLTWVTQPLVPGVYDVSVESRIGTTWSGYCGNVCSLTIVSSSSMLTEQDADIALDVPALTLWPNPNSDGRVRLHIGSLTEATHHVSIDIFDLLGAHVSNEQVQLNGSVINTNIDLNTDMPRGVYIVNVTVDDHLFTERLVVQ